VNGDTPHTGKVGQLERLSIVGTRAFFGSEMLIRAQPLGRRTFAKCRNHVITATRYFVSGRPNRLISPPPFEITDSTGAWESWGSVGQSYSTRSELQAGQGWTLRKITPSDMGDPTLMMGEAGKLLRQAHKKKKRRSNEARKRGINDSCHSEKSSSANPGCFRDSFCR
jgi:hypothetical protein